MSCDLTVRLTQSVDITALLQESAAVIRELLNVAIRPAFMAFRLEKGVLLPMPSGSLHNEGQVLVIKMEGFDEAIGVTLTEITPHPAITEKDVGWWVGISVQATRTPLEFAMAASIAIALARLVETTVIDDAQEWNRVFEQLPDEFLRTLRAQRPFDDLRSAAKWIFSKMPVGGEANNEI